MRSQTADCNCKKRQPFSGNPADQTFRDHLPQKARKKCRTCDHIYQKEQANKSYSKTSWPFGKLPICRCQTYQPDYIKREHYGRSSCPCHGTDAQHRSILKQAQQKRRRKHQYDLPKSCLWEILLFSANLITFILSGFMALSEACVSGHFWHTAAGISASGRAVAKSFHRFPSHCSSLQKVPDMGHRSLRVLTDAPR